jgi:hypothetical protein
MSAIGSLFGGGSDTPQPDPAIGQAAAQNAATGKEMADLGREQLAWNKQQYADLAPKLKQILDQQVAVGNVSKEMADQQWQHYQTTYLPVEEQSAKEAMAEGSPAQQEAEANQARATVAQQYEDQRGAQQRDLAARGINPSSGAAMAADRSSSFGQAGAEAGAMNNARTNARMRGIALRTGVAQFGRNMPATGIAADQTALGAGSSAAATGAGSLAAGNAGMNAAIPWYSGGAAATQAGGNLYLGQFGGNIQSYAARSGAQSSMMGGLGSAAGYFFGGPQSSKPWIFNARGGVIRHLDVVRKGYAHGGIVRAARHGIRVVRPTVPTGLTPHGLVRSRPVKAHFALGGFISDVMKFEKSKLGNVIDKYKDDPERPLLGINTPFESQVWGKILGKDYTPTVDMYGGATKDDSAKAKSEGINTGPGESMHNIARAITSAFALGYGADAAGVGTPSSAASSAPAVGGDAGAFDASGSAGVFDSQGNPLYKSPAAANDAPAWQRWAKMGTQMQGGGGAQQPASVNQSSLVAPYQAPQEGDIAQMQADILARLQALSPTDRQNLAKLLSQQYGMQPPKQYAGGGVVSGPGTSTSDSIPAVIDGQQPAALSNGEAVLNKPAVDLVGEDFVHRINRAGLISKAAKRGVRYATAR